MWLDVLLQQVRVYYAIVKQARRGITCTSTLRVAYLRDTRSHLSLFFLAQISPFLEVRVKNISPSSGHESDFLLSQ